MTLAAEHNPSERTPHQPSGDIEHVDHLAGISEELALALFDEVIRRGKLTPRVRTLKPVSSATDNVRSGPCADWQWTLTRGC